MPEEFAVTVHRHGRDAVVAISGELDLDTAQRLREHLDVLVDAGAEIAIDASGVSFIDSAGLTTLLAARQSVRDEGGDLRLTVASERVASVAKMAGVSDLLPSDDAS
ncbi:MAG: STAS domain-containing protein [Acidimicrobiales bacterium]|nr:STAS domain-containing protein [Acidimicrobiales bacterium]